MKKGKEAVKKNTHTFLFLHREKVRDVYEAEDGRHLFEIMEEKL
jgi:hypothetical protein